MPVQLEMRIGGGYGFVDNRADDQFDVASIVPTEASHVLHRLTVRVEKGATAVPPPPDSIDPTDPEAKGWDLNARKARMEIWPGGAVPSGNITPPDADDRRNFLPDVPELGRSALSPEWVKRIAARLTLRAGRLKVDRLKPAQGMFEFRHPTRRPKPRQQVSNGLTGLIHDLSEGSSSVNSITLALFPLATADHDIISGATKPTATYVVKPDSGTLVKLQVDSLEPRKDMTNGMDLEEFGIFYNLLHPVPAITDRYIPRWFFAHPISALRSPGSECPPGYYDDPNG